MQFFVSVWARVKFLFTTALAEACECSAPAKSRASHENSPSYKEDNEDVVVISKDPSYPINTAVAATVIDCDTPEYPPTPPPTRDISEDKVIAEISVPNVEATPLLLLRESSTPLEDFYEEVDDSGSVEITSIAEVHLEPVELSVSLDDHVSGAVAFAQPILLTNVAPKTHSAKLLSLVEKSLFVELPEEPEEEELEFVEDYPPEHLCSSSEISSEAECPVPLTVLGRLYTQLQNGELSLEKHAELSNTVLNSIMPRNLSDTSETRKTMGANQLYAWQLPPPLPGLNGEKEVIDVIDGAVVNPQAFIESLISDAVEQVSREGSYEAEDEDDDDEGLGDDAQVLITPPRPPSPPIERKRYLPETPHTLACRCASDISYDGVLTASLDRVRSVSTYTNEYNLRSKRSSSLKSDRSPVGTPCRKIVRFADSLGLDLANVRQIKDQDHPPQIPASATFDLNLESEKSLSSVGVKQFQLCFPQPGASGAFMHRVLTSSVCLENARVDSSRGLLTGTVRVKSVGFEKKVAVRITYNNWATFSEVPASYVQDSHDGATDRFSFSAVFPTTMVADDRAQFAVRYETHEGAVFWDNNHGENYLIVCYAKNTDMAGDGSWIHYL